MKRKVIDMAKIITGKYEQDENFTTVYADNCVYTIARKTGDYGFCHIGDRAFIGTVMTQKEYDEGVARCTREGTFELKDSGWLASWS